MRHLELSLVLWQYLNDLLKRALTSGIRRVELDTVIELLDEIPLHTVHPA